MIRVECSCGAKLKAHDGQVPSLSRFSWVRPMKSKLAHHFRLALKIWLLAVCSVCIADEKPEPSKSTEAEAAKREFYIRIGSLPEAEVKWLKEIQAKHDRIVKQLEESKKDPQITVERYTREEAIAALAFEISAAATVELQAKRDGVEVLSFAQANDQYAKSPLRLIASIKGSRMREIESKIKLIAATKSDMKKAMIVDDRLAIEKWAAVIKTNQDGLRELISAPVSSGNLNMLALAEGQIGNMSQFGYKILQIVDKSTGKALIYHSRADAFPTVRVVGTNLTNLVDDSRFPTGRVFAVLGTVTYETIGGGSKTIFELQDITTVTLFTDDELKTARESCDAGYKIEFTAEESKKMELAKTANVAAAKKKQDGENEAKQKKEAESKAMRAQSFVDSGKVLMKKDNSSGAKKQFEKAIAESPESSAGKEAKKLLESLP